MGDSGWLSRHCHWLPIPGTVLQHPCYATLHFSANAAHLCTCSRVGEWAGSGVGYDFCRALQGTAQVEDRESLPGTHAQQIIKCIRKGLCWQQEGPLQSIQEAFWGMERLRATVASQNFFLIFFQRSGGKNRRSRDGQQRWWMDESERSSLDLTSHMDQPWIFLMQWRSAQSYFPPTLPSSCSWT